MIDCSSKELKISKINVSEEEDPINRTGKAFINVMQRNSLKAKNSHIYRLKEFTMF